MRRMAEAVLHDDDLAADVVQDTFVKLWQLRWRLGLMKEVQGYCMKTLHNRCIDILRQQKRLNTAKTTDLEIEDPRLADMSNDTDELYRRLEKSIASLSPQQQKLIEMKYVKQLNIHEIAEQTGLSITNITTLLSRAYSTLRQKMDTGNKNKSLNH